MAAVARRTEVPHEGHAPGSFQGLRVEGVLAGSGGLSKQVNNPYNPYSNPNNPSALNPNFTLKVTLTLQVGFRVQLLGADWGGGSNAVRSLTFTYPRLEGPPFSNFPQTLNPIPNNNPKCLFVRGSAAVLEEGTQKHNSS